MKTKGRRKSGNIVDLRPAKKGDRLKATPKRTFPVELNGTRAMNDRLTIEAFRASRDGAARMKRLEAVLREQQREQQRKRNTTK